MPTITDAQRSQILTDILATSEATYAPPQAWWAIARDGNAGESVINAGDISQCIDIILLSPRGSDPFRPTFASRIHDIIDNPQPSITSPVVRECTEAIERWEPRVRVTSVVPTFNRVKTGGVEIEINWRLREGIETGTSTLTV